MTAQLFDTPPIEATKVDGIERARKRAFIFKDEAKIAETYFRKKIHHWLVDDAAQESFSQMLWNAIYEFNGNGKTIKYLYFNERTQRLRIDNDFWAWAKLAIREIEMNIEKINQVTA